MAKKKQKENIFQQLEGQVSIWDLEITQKSHSFTRTKEKVTEKEVSFTKSLKNITPKKSEKSISTLKFTDNQQEFITKNKIMGNDNLSRVIIYCGGGIGIESKEGNGYKTSYVNKEGKEEFISTKKSRVLPMDKIIYYKEDMEPNETQLEKLEELKLDKDIKRIIRRKGDENIIVELDNKVISIISKGWVLEFENINITYDEDELEKEDLEESIEEIQKKVKVGDIVETTYFNKTITGRISHVYGPGNMSLNIIFDNGTKHTAIYRGHIKRLIKSA